MTTRHRFPSPRSGDRLCCWPFHRLAAPLAVMALLAVANADHALDAAPLRDLRVDGPPGMELTFGNDATPAEAAAYAALGVTSVESYVHWAGVEPEENHWDWSEWHK